MFGATGAGLSKLRHWQNGHKRPRRSLDQWDRVGFRAEKSRPDANLPLSKVRTLSEDSISAVQTDMTKSAVMDRDRRLTGLLRGQSDAALAPAGFELNNPWRVRFLLRHPRNSSAVTDVGIIRLKSGWRRRASNNKTESPINDYLYNQIQHRMMRIPLLILRIPWVSSIYLVLLPRHGTSTPASHKFYMMISGRFLFRPSRSVQAWQSLWLDI